MKITNEFNLSSKEEEIIILKNTLDIIHNAVNYSMLDFFGTPPREVRAKTSEHLKLFLILLVDFLSGTSSILSKNQKSYCEHLSDICQQNHSDKNIKALRKSVNAFNNWISEELVIKDLKLNSSKDFFDIKITRKDLIQICGNICKHNITNLAWKIKKLRKIINENQKDASDDDVIVSLYELYDIFINDYVDVQTTIWAELLNNIRIGILQYLKPVFNKSIVYENDVYGKYHYEYLSEISSPLAKEFFWNLMNDVREDFYIKDFESSDIIKKVNKEQNLHK